MKDSRTEKFYTETEVIEMLRGRMGVKNQPEFSTELKVSHALLNQVLNGNRRPGRKILQYLGLVKTTVYYRRKER